MTTTDTAVFTVTHTRAPTRADSGTHTCTYPAIPAWTSGERSRNTRRVADLHVERPEVLQLRRDYRGFHHELGHEILRFNHWRHKLLVCSAWRHALRWRSQSPAAAATAAPTLFLLRPGKIEDQRHAAVDRDNRLGGLQRGFYCGRDDQQANHYGVND